MKKYVLSLIIAALSVCGISTQAVLSETNERGCVSVIANTYKEVEPDVAEITIEVVTSDLKSLQVATTQNKQISDKVYSAIKSMLNTSFGDFVKTANYSAEPQYSYLNGKKTFDRYQVSNSIILRTKNIKDVGAIIDKALSLGATNISNLTFTVSNYDIQCDELLSLAAQKAKRQADVIVHAVSSSVIGVKSLDGSCSNSNSSTRIRYNLMKSTNFDGASMETSTPIESGTVKIYANINASFYVK